MTCTKHNWKTYIGLTGLDPFDYCHDCGIKKSDITEQQLLDLVRDTIKITKDYLSSYPQTISLGASGPSVGPGIINHVPAAHNLRTFYLDPTKPITLSYIWDVVGKITKSENNPITHIYFSVKDYGELMGSGLVKTIAYHFPDTATSVQSVYVCAVFYDPYTPEGVMYYI